MKVDKELINKIKKEILSMVKKDQALRYANKVDVKLDKENTEKLKKIILQIGWPKISLVGEEVSDGAWLLVQHSDQDINFQKECLRLVQREAETDEIDYKLIPLLVDRILVNEGKKQIYGTQFYKNKKTGKLVPRPIKNRAQVNKLRAAFGMESIGSYGKLLNESIARIESQNRQADI